MRIKLLALINLLFLLRLNARANPDLPYMPLSFVLTTGKESYYEGEKVDFILRIQNTDTSKAYPVFLPHTQNTGLKLLYFTVYDPWTKAFLERTKEDRKIDMMVHDTGSVKKIMLGPKQSVQIPFYWNDFENYYSYHSQIASHHKLDKPLFVGEYWIISYYNPEGIPGTDSFYHYLGSTNDEQHPTKLNFWKGGMTATCNLKIRKAPTGIISIQGVKYNCRDLYANEPFPLNAGQQFHYYTQDDTLQSVVFVETPVGEYKIKGRFYFYDRIKKLEEFITRYPDGVIEKYWLQRGECPTAIYRVEYYPDGAKSKLEQRWSDGTVHGTWWLPDGRITKEELYSADAKKLLTTIYHYDRSGKLKRKEKQVQEEPCLEVLLE